MQRLRELSCVAILGLAAAGGAAQAAPAAALAPPVTAAAPATAAVAAAALAAPATESAARGTESAGVASSTAGDNWTAANLFEQAVQGKNTPLNRFNLASAYQRTGRLRQATVLYRSVMVDGIYTKAITNPLDVTPGARVYRVNIAEESARRIHAMETAPRSIATGAISVSSASGDAAALELVSASSLVGGPTRGVVSDARALQLDHAAAVKLGQ